MVKLFPKPSTGIDELIAELMVDLVNDNVRKITDETLQKEDGMKYIVSHILQELGKRTFQRRKPRSYEEIDPTINMLKKLPERFFGKMVEVNGDTGFSIPYSLIRINSAFYVRCHISGGDDFVQEYWRLKSLTQRIGYSAVLRPRLQIEPEKSSKHDIPSSLYDFD